MHSYEDASSTSYKDIFFKKNFKIKSIPIMIVVILKSLVIFSMIYFSSLKSFVQKTLSVLLTVLYEYAQLKM